MSLRKKSDVSRKTEYPYTGRRTKPECFRTKKAKLATQNLMIAFCVKL